ncbi:hypothetical protein Tco_0216339 [Tanacetum coccineum]
MANLKFDDTHNMVVLLAKLAESERFEQIVDFLNAHTIKYALTINPTIYTSCIKQLWATVKAKTVNGEVQLQVLVDGKKIIIITESTIRRDLQLEDAEGIDCLPNATIFEQLTLMGRTKRKDTEIPQSSSPIEPIADEAIYKERDDSLVRAATTASSLEAEQDSGNINKTQSKATLNEPSSIGTSSGSGPRRQDTIGDTIAQTRLKRRVKKLERRNKSRNHGLKRLYKVGSSRRVESSKEEGLGEEDASKQGRIVDIDANIGITLDSTHYDADADTDMFRAHDLDGDEVVVETEVAHEVVVETEVASKDVNLSVDEVTLAWALAALKSAKPKVDKEQAPTPTISLKEKGKSIMVEEPAKMKKKDQISFDEQEAKRLQVEFDEEERITRGKKEANVALTEEWVDIQAKIEADRLLAERF